MLLLEFDVAVVIVVVIFIYSLLLLLLGSCCHFLCHVVVVFCFRFVPLLPLLSQATSLAVLLFVLGLCKDASIMRLQVPSPLSY